MLLQRISPPAWTFDVYMPPRGRCFSGSEEESIFREAAAGGKEETLEALAVLYHGLVPALLSHDLDQFGVFMHEYQSRGLKKVEIARQHPSVSALMRRLRSVYPCVAMSSMGPAVVGIRETSTDFPELPGIPIPFVTTSVDDEGAQILWDV
jgi:beta-ribofuranosylaminobenzene 5'-phosphate synthase